MKLSLAIAILAAITNCAPHAFPMGSPNPLDTPGEAEGTVEDLHAENIRSITR